MRWRYFYKKLGSVFTSIRTVDVTEIFFIFRYLKSTSINHLLVPDYILYSIQYCMQIYSNIVNDIFVLRLKIGRE